MPRLGACVAVGVLLLVSVAVADPLDKAKSAIDNSDYFSARSALDEALRSGTYKPAQLADIYRLSGIVAAALGDAKQATDAFQRCLSLTPNATLPAGTSPKISRPFEDAQAFMKDRQPLKISTATQNDPPIVTIEVVSDPLSMISKVRAIVVVDGKPEREIDKPVGDDKSIEIDLPKGRRIDLRVAALDDHGNRLTEVGTKEVPIVIVGKGGGEKVVKNGNGKGNGKVVAPPPPPRPYHPRPLYWRWWLWGGVGIAFLGAGGYFGIDAVRAKNDLDALNAESSNHTFDEAKAVESHARRSVLFTNIGLAAGGVFALTATVLYLTRPRPSTERRLALTPVVDANGGALVLGGSF